MTVLTDCFDQPYTVGDVIVYATVSGSTPKLTRAEVVEITDNQAPYGPKFKVRVRPERSNGSRREFVWLTRAPIIKVANGVDFEEYREALLERYGELNEEVSQVETG